MEQICLDTGVLSIILSENPTEEIKRLQKNAHTNKVECHILSPMLVETYWHICKLKGIEIAKIAITSFVRKFPHVLVDLDENIILKAGMVKSQHRATLSYNDCISIAYCLNTKMEFHTTEKTIRKIKQNTLEKLKIVQYNF